MMWQELIKKPDVWATFIKQKINVALLFFIRREEEFFIEQIKYYYTEQSPGNCGRTV